jgi:hypothetical protein
MGACPCDVCLCVYGTCVRPAGWSRGILFATYDLLVSGSARAKKGRGARVYARVRVMVFVIVRVCGWPPPAHHAGLVPYTCAARLLLHGLAAAQ